MHTYIPDMFSYPSDPMHLKIYGLCWLTF